MSKVIGMKNLHAHVTELPSSNDISNIGVSASPEEKGYQVLSENINNPENRKYSKNNTLNLFPLKKMLSKEKRKEVINKLTMHFTDSPKLDLYFSVDKEGPGIPLDEVLKAYPENVVPNQPIVWNHTLKFPDKSIAVEVS
ncbi:hypothetical protein F8M41_020322 [Gigaspora margarita]|uniref:Uncharacterized protein n=1 Tax=Gigaspora margarita TaxID=4874 RepID=A0A8H4EJX7_GIGMA|nr:hypothetical protein F8M41_020322 [Gigaspora margarita]